MDMLVVLAPAFGAWFIGRRLSAAILRRVDAMLDAVRGDSHGG